MWDGRGVKVSLSVITIKTKIIERIFNFSKFMEALRKVYSSSKDELTNFTKCKPPCTYYKYSLVDTFIDPHELEVGKFYCKL